MATSKKNLQKMTTAEVIALKAHGFRQELEARRKGNKPHAEDMQLLQRRCREELKRRAEAGDPDTGTTKGFFG